MNKKELMEKIKQLQKTCLYETISLQGKIDNEKSHTEVDKLLWAYIGFTEEELKIIKDLCPWTA